MSVSSATVTITTAANYIPEAWSTESLVAAEFAEVFAKRVNRKYEASAKIGDTVHVAYTSNLNTQTKTTGLRQITGASLVELLAA